MDSIVGDCAFPASAVTFAVDVVAAAPVPVTTIVPKFFPFDGDVHFVSDTGVHPSGHILATGGNTIFAFAELITLPIYARIMINMITATDNTIALKDIIL
jgi:hypothetical protein